MWRKYLWKTFDAEKKAIFTWPMYTERCQRNKHWRAHGSSYFLSLDSLSILFPCNPYFKREWAHMNVFHRFTSIFITFGVCSFFSKFDSSSNGFPFIFFWLYMYFGANHLYCYQISECIVNNNTVRYIDDSKESPRNSRKSFLSEILKMLVAIPMATQKNVWIMCLA